MAYYYSNYDENSYHYYNNQSYTSYPSYSYYTNQPNYDHTHYANYEYQQAPTQSLIGFFEQHETESPAQKVANVDDHVGFATSHLVSDAKDQLDFEQHHREGFHGGYNMDETYGTPLLASDEICYPPSKDEKVPLVGDFSYDSVASPYGKETQVVQSEAKPCKEIVVSDPIEEDIGSEPELDEEDIGSEPELNEEEDEEEEEEDDEKEIVVRRQIPPGYGLEAMDLCEGVFGGYFPCLWKRNRGSNYNQNEVYETNGDCNDNYWKGTADYLFGNPNPYGGSMLEKGSYGDPVHSYQRYYPQEAIRGQVEYGENYGSWLPNSGYN